MELRLKPQRGGSRRDAALCGVVRGRAWVPRNAPLPRLVVCGRVWVGVISASEAPVQLQLLVGNLAGRCLLQLGNDSVNRHHHALSSGTTGLTAQHSGRYGVRRINHLGNLCNTGDLLDSIYCSIHRSTDQLDAQRNCEGLLHHSVKPSGVACAEYPPRVNSANAG